MSLRTRSYLSEGSKSEEKKLIKKIRNADSMSELRDLARQAEKSGSQRVSSAWHEREHELSSGGRGSRYFT